MAERRERLPELDEPCPEDREIVCAACGYRQAIPEVVSTTTTVDPSGLAPPERIADLGRPPVGLAAWLGERRLDAWSAAGSNQSDPIISVSLEHDRGWDSRADPWVLIQTGTSMAFDPVEHWLVPWVVILRSDEWRDQADGDAAYAREQLRRSKAEKRVRALRARRIALRLDGEPTEFEALGDETAWAAYADLDGIGITVAAHGVPTAEVELASANPDDYLA